MKITTFNGHDINDGTNYAARFPAEGGSWGLPPIRALLVERSGAWPLVAGIQRRGHTLTLEIEIVNLGSLATLRAQLLGWLEVEEPQALVVKDDDDSRERYMDVLPVQVIPRSDTLANVFTVVCQVHGDVKWRATTADSAEWEITASGAQRVLANAGDAEAYPILTIEPTTPKTGSPTYARWVPVRWRVAAAHNNYPYELTNGGFNTATLVTAGKAQADGDDFRVHVDGAEVPRWFGTGAGAFNQAATKLWVNLNFAANVAMTLKTALLATGDVDTIEVNQDIGGLADAGIVLIGNEAFTYASKSNGDRTLNNVSRAAKGTAAAAHSAGTAVWWIQHDIWIVYGDAAAAAPTIDDSKRPAFNLASSNTSWDYDEFGQYPLPGRSGQWSQQSVTYGLNTYGDHSNITTNPWEELGCRTFSETGWARWYLYNPCRITNMNCANGEKRAETDLVGWTAELQSSSDGASWNTEYAIPAPSAVATWEAWSRNEALATGATYAALYLYANGRRYTRYCEVADVTLTLNSSYTPTTAFIGAEQGNYELAATISNLTTGHAIQVTFNMGLGKELEVDTVDKTVTYLADGSNQFQALTLIGAARRAWLALAPGNNTLRFDDVGTGNVTIDLVWRKRWR